LLVTTALPLPPPFLLSPPRKRKGSESLSRARRARYARLAGGGGGGAHGGPLRSAGRRRQLGGRAGARSTAGASTFRGSQLGVVRRRRGRRRGGV
jgi:hypothetical protein